MDPVKFWDYSFAEVELMLRAHEMKSNPGAEWPPIGPKRTAADLQAEFEALKTEFGKARRKKGGERA